MEYIDKIETRDIHLDYDLQITGILNGNIVIVSNGNLLLNGILDGSITMQGGSCSVYGTVNGNIHNDGGKIEIFGIVNGNVNTRLGQTEIDPDAIINSN